MTNHAEMTKEQVRLRLIELGQRDPPESMIVGWWRIVNGINPPQIEAGIQTHREWQATRGIC